ncbi:6-phosphogluconate dehydrogenase, partial [Halorubrum sp. CBA1125]|uniref:NAD(P)-binding domain-containing protein n=1 Tax=Halorubrum sp. CBA1125 TaxID=2668072 RepID=UPI00135F0E5A
MEFGVIGLGRMGQIVANRSLNAGHDVVAFDLSAEATAEVAENGAEPADSVADLCDRLSESPADGGEDGKRIWLMVPAGDAVDATLADLEPHLDGDDVV